jgi:uncharacterized peroxidase-related enzyme
MPKLPSLRENAHLSELFTRFPQSAGSLMQFTQVVMREDGALDVADREMIAAFVSGLNACGFCHGAHLIYAQAFGVDADLLQASIDDLETSRQPAKMAALLGYLKALNTLPTKLVQKDMDTVLAAGWSEKALFEAIQIAALFNMMNRIVEGTGVSFDYAQNGSIHPANRLGDRVQEHSYVSTPMGKPEPR